MAYRELPITGEHKGFRSREARNADGSRCNWDNAFYVCEDGEERCVGQTNNIIQTADGYLRHPLPAWMTKKPEAWSPYSDQDHIRSTCAHGVSLEVKCDRCIESYGSARAM